MSLEVYTGTQFPGWGNAEWYNAVKEMESMLTSHTPCYREEVVTDSGYSYSVILNAGDGRYLRLRTTEGESNPSVNLSEGTYSDGAFSALASVGFTPASAPSYPANTQPRLCVINGGVAWGIDFSYKSAASSGTDSVQQITLRAVELISSIDGICKLSMCINRRTRTSAGTAYIIAFPSADNLLISGIEYPLLYIRETRAAYSVPAGKEMLSPTLICTELANGLGVPTIGGKTIYMMSMEFNAYTEFYVGAKKYVSLGYAAIEST